MTNSTSLPEPGTYTLSPQEVVVRCDCKAMFGLFTVRGTFGLVAGQVTVGADPARSSVRVVVDAASWESGNGTRDADVKSRNLLDVREYPEISFAADGARPDGAGWALDGTVTAHGATKPATLQLSDVASDGDGAIRFRATARLDRTSFGITKMKGRVGQFAQLAVEGLARRA